MCLFALFSSMVFAGDREDIMDVVMKLKAMEKDNGRMRFDMDCIKNELATMKSKSAAAAVPDGKTAMFAALGIGFYGYIKTDLIYSDSQAAELTLSAPAAETDDQKEFFITAKESRLGMDITGPRVGDSGKVIGKIEGDFWGNTSDGATTPGFRFRQAYIDLKFANWDVLAGQTWDFFAPLNPSTLHLGLLWQQGNIGDRHPQVRLTSKVCDFLGGTLTSQVGILDSKTDLQEHTGTPVVGVYESFEDEFFSQPLYIGAGGAYGQTNTSTTITRDLDMWAVVLALKYKLTQKISLCSEGYLGAGLAAFRGGSATSVDDNKAIRTRGGFAQLTYDPTAKLQFNAGGGIDDVFSDSISTSVWSENYACFLNSKYKLAKNVTWGLEFMQVDTEYANQGGGDALRFQSSLMFNF